LFLLFLLSSVKHRIHTALIKNVYRPYCHMFSSNKRRLENVVQYCWLLTVFYELFNTHILFLMKMHGLFNYHKWIWKHICHTVLQSLLKNNLLQLFHFEDDSVEVLEPKTILIQNHDTYINFACICKYCAKFTSQVTLKVHFKTITEAKISPSLNITAKSNLLFRLLGNWCYLPAELSVLDWSIWRYIQLEIIYIVVATDFDL